MKVMQMLLCTIFFSNTFVWFSFANVNRLNNWKAGDKILNNAQESTAVNWLNGIIPYYFDNNSYDHVIAMRLRLSMNMLESVSCIRFKPIIGSPNMHTTWLHFTNPLFERDCMHEPRYNESGEVVLVLGLDCLSEEQVLHTLLHGVGFKDEVAHIQRDQYIRILWNNIQPAYQHLFRIQADETRSKTSVEYDPMSIMHFHDRAFSINGQATIVPLMTGLIINPSRSLSQLDTMKLRLRFGHECNKRNADDLMDTCKMVLHNVEKKNSRKPSEDEDKKLVAIHNDQGNNNNGNEDHDVSQYGDGANDTDSPNSIDQNIDNEKADPKSNDQSGEEYESNGDEKVIETNDKFNEDGIKSGERRVRKIRKNLMKINKLQV